MKILTFSAKRTHFQHDTYMKHKTYSIKIMVNSIRISNNEDWHLNRILLFGLKKNNIKNYTMTEIYGWHLHNKKIILTLRKHSQ